MSIGVSRKLLDSVMLKNSDFKEYFLAKVSHIFIASEKGPLLIVENDLDEKRVQMVC